MNTSALCVRDVDFLFTPFVYRKLRLPTRLVMAPVQRFFAQDGVPSVDMGLYYYRRAVQSLGMVVTEPVAVPDEAAALDAGMARFYGGEALRAWRRICRLVHTTPCRLAPLLSHAGMLRAAKDGVPSIGPSGLPVVTGGRMGEAMSRSRIDSVVQAFGASAGAARVLGFDAVEINGADAHLIEQFLRPACNARLDEYGGDIGGRARFACRVVHAVRKAVGRHFPVLFRLGQFSPLFGDVPLAGSPAELQQLLSLLCDAGVDIFCGVDARASQPAFEGSALNMAGWIRRLTGRPVITEGRVGLDGVPLPPLVRRMQAWEFDMISAGRSLLADAEWGAKIRQAREAEIIPFTSRSWFRLL